MPSLLELPAELRALIIYQVLGDRREPPSAPSQSNRIDFKDIRYKAWRHHSAAIYNEQRGEHCPSNALPLLLTNHQLSAETQAIVELEHQKQGVSYLLDISVVNDQDLYLTWLSVPWIANRVDSLAVELRLFGNILLKSISRTLGGDGGRRGFHWSFYAVLERFLRYGPVDQKKLQVEGSTEDRTSRLHSHRRNQTFEDREMSVKTLTLYFSSAEDKLPFPPDDIGFARWHTRVCAFDHFHDHADNDDLKMYRTRPEWLAKYLLGQIQGLLSMGYHTAEYGRILYERIGTLRFVVDGDVTTVDLASKLASLHFDDSADTFGDVWPRENRVPFFREWKKQTLARREKLGFPVVWPESSDSQT